MYTWYIFFSTKLWVVLLKYVKFHSEQGRVIDQTTQNQLQKSSINWRFFQQTLTGTYDKKYLETYLYNFVHLQKIPLCMCNDRSLRCWYSLLHGYSCSCPLNTRRHLRTNGKSQKGGLNTFSVKLTVGDKRHFLRTLSIWQNWQARPGIWKG